MERESHASYRDGGDMRMNIASPNGNINALKTCEGMKYTYISSMSIKLMLEMLCSIWHYPTMV